MRSVWYFVESLEDGGGMYCCSFEGNELCNSQPSVLNVQYKNRTKVVLLSNQYCDFKIV